jgi:hypothetical protein
VPVKNADVAIPADVSQDTHFFRQLNQRKIGLKFNSTCEIIDITEVRLDWFIE